ncbi:glycosyltransferase family 4 protein [Fictibacillus gelatini]|uniref:glycosyltransferase family 4 protein n=1 Tax=Fictibacillus gelatini TaxID=225985 RepID=UPI00041BA18B|nr:glycosyltransferase family 4 protein [Fictibacillus gelatini]
MENNKYYKELKSNAKKVVLFTANFQGGILQFSMQLHEVFLMLGYTPILFVPSNANVKNQDHPSDLIKKFKKEKKIIRSKSCEKIATEIEKLNPNLVVFCDDTIISTQVLLSLGKKIATSMYVHDVTPHPARFEINEFLKQLLKKRMFKKAIKLVDQIVLLSENSYRLFQSYYPTYLKKATWMPLGPHVPKVEIAKPIEFGEKIKEGYYLFFGRISKYKGVKNLLKAYNSISTGETPLLVIAGGGELELEEIKLIQSNKNIVLINRFISDSEMLYLFKYSLVVVLPYIEASQSGVIPIAYYFGKPVITSNVPGLVEFVDQEHSGIVCSTNEEIKNALVKVRDATFYQKLSGGARLFYLERLNWVKNVKNCFEYLMKDQKGT